MKLLVGNLILKGLVQQGTQTQAGVSFLPVLSSLTRPALEETGPTQETLIDLVGSSNSSDGPPSFMTPPPGRPEKIEWGNIELPNTEELA